MPHPRQWAAPFLWMGCAGSPITADTLDPDWKREVGWPEATEEATSTAIVTDPTAITGELGIEFYGGECMVRWTLDGERTTCDDCVFAFETAFDLVEDTCGGTSSLTATVSLNRSYLYVNYSRIAPYEQVGNTISFDTRSGSGGSTGYYDDYYAFEYYGQFQLLDR